ncbi:serine/threonine protein kinase, partial [Streptomyces zhihengii]
RDVRAAFRRRPRVATAVAGGVAFTAAVLIGMALFSPEESSADTPLTDPAPSAPAQESGAATPSGEPAGTSPEPVADPAKGKKDDKPGGEHKDGPKDGKKDDDEDD